MLALIRVTLALLAWAQWAGAMRPNWHLDALWRLAPTTAFFFVSTAMLVGYRTRLATLLTGALGLWHWAVLVRIQVLPTRIEVLGTQQVGLLAVAILLLAVAPSGAAWSVDAWRSGRQLAVDQAGLVLLRMWGFSALLWGWVDQTGLAWMSGMVVESWWRGNAGGSLAVLAGPVHGVWWGLAVCWWSLGAVALVGVWRPALRRWAIVAGVLWFGLAAAVWPAGVWAATGIALWLCWLEPSDVGREVDLVLGRAAPSGQ